MSMRISNFDSDSVHFRTQCTRIPRMYHYCVTSSFILDT